MALPYEVVAMVVNYVSHQRGTPEALAIWLLFEIYGRPGCGAAGAFRVRGSPLHLGDAPRAGGRRRLEDGRVRRGD
eukprot:3543542-Pyramimonas_sp.AAC.1